MFYWYTFADGTCYCSRLSKSELRQEELRHGKLIRQEAA